MEEKNLAIVGVSRGFGYALGDLASRRGWKVLFVGRDEEKVKDISGRVQGSSYATADALRKGDISKALGKLGRLQGLVISIGGYLEDTVENPSHVEEMVSNHIRAPIQVLNEALPFLSPSSSVVLVSALRGVWKALPNQLSYSVAKAGTAKIVETAAISLLNRGIRVNGIAPSWITQDYEPDRDFRSLRRLGDPGAPPEDFALVTLWLLSEESEWVNGTVIPVDGGFRLRS